MVALAIVSLVQSKKEAKNREIKVELIDWLHKLIEVGKHENQKLKMKNPAIAVPSNIII